MARHHCFVSASSITGVQRWRWHAQTHNGLPLRSCDCDFDSFDECVKHAFAHGYAHVEVPVLDSVRATPAFRPSIRVCQEPERDEATAQDEVHDIAIVRAPSHELSARHHF